MPLTTIAWFTPLPPSASGVSQYNAELLPGLASAYAIDVFVDGSPDRCLRPDPNTPVYSAHDFVWKHFRRPYDLVVYQMGNAPCHDYMWAYLVRYPGLVVLHDGQLHHARARWLLEQQREEDYRDEFRFNHPDASIAIVELGIAGLLGSLTYLWPMRRVVIESARLVVVHNRWLADDILEELPHAHVQVVDMGVPAPSAPEDATAMIRRRHQIPADAVLFVAFGEVTPEKRIAQVIRSLASIAGTVPNAHLLLAGRAVGHYDAAADAREHGVADRVTIAGFVPQEEVAAYLAAADVCLCLRWPSSRETSAAWLRCLAAGKPTVTTDLAHMVDIPALDPRSWSLLHAPDVPPDDTAAAGAPDPASAPTPDPVCVSVDILDEDHSLRLAMRRLATDPRLRAALGQQARALWRERFTLDRMVARYRDVLQAACRAVQPDAGARRLLPSLLPAHFLTDGTEFATAQLQRMGVPASIVDDIWQRHEPLERPDGENSPPVRLTPRSPEE